MISCSVNAQKVIIPEVEKVNFFTDRSTYITGEDICFSAFIFQEGYLPALSSVLYVQVISAEGSSFSAGKFEINNFQSSGKLTIPEDLITGIYYIRAYTKYMRNAGPASYAVLALKIINPKRNEVLPGKDTLKTTDAFLTNEISDKIQIKTDKVTVFPGEDIITTVTYGLMSKENISGLNVTVAPAEASKIIGNSLSGSVRRIDKLQYMPEVYGITVSGLVTKDNKPVKDVNVNLSLIEKYHDFQSELTDSTGRFLFLLPMLNDLADLYIGLNDQKDDIPYRLLVDNEYCTLPVNLPQPVFSLTENERTQALKMAINEEINSIYHAEPLPISTETTDDIKHPFYGKPVFVLYLKDYVQLPTLEEYFNELPGYVKVRKREGKKYFKIFGTQPEMENYDPLILVDGVYIDDPEKILEAAPVNIDRIEMINVPYLKGDMLFGGIISIISKKGDLAGIDLPSSGFFVSYHFLNSDFCAPDKYIPQPDTPDSRNTVFFAPFLTLNSDNTSTFQFKAPATPGIYSIVLNGVSKHGTVFGKKFNFEVVNKNSGSPIP